MLFSRVPRRSLLLFKVIPCLEVHPETFRKTEVPRESQGRVGRDRAFVMHDFIDPSQGDTDVSRQAILADSHGEEELLVEDFAGVDGFQFGGHDAP